MHSELISSPYQAEYDKLCSELKDLNIKKSTLTSDLDRYQKYRSTDFNTLITAASLQISEINNQLEAIKTLVVKDKKTISENDHTSKWSPLYWLQDSISRNIDDIKRDAVKSAQSRIKKSLHKLESLTAHVKILSADRKALISTQDFISTFDLSNSQNVLNQLDTSLQLKNNDLQKISRKQIELAKKITPLKEQLLQLDQDIQSLQLKINTAECLAATLANHSSDHQEDKKCRWETHEQSTELLGSSNPSHALINFKKLLEKSLRDQTKILDRIKEINQQHTIRIGSILIDGSNLCYKTNGEFIGLKALIAIQPQLTEQYPHASIILFFDPGIRRQVSMNSQTIKTFFSECEIVVTPNKADEHILNRANTQVDTFIITNDAFIDYPEFSDLRKTKILKHVIDDQFIQIPTLGIRVRYQ